MAKLPKNEIVLLMAAEGLVMIRYHYGKIYTRQVITERFDTMDDAIDSIKKRYPGFKVAAV